MKRTCMLPLTNVTPSFVIRFRFLYLPFSTTTGFLNNSQTNSIKNPTIPTRKDIVIIQFGMLSRLTNDNPTFMPLNVICIATGIPQMEVPIASYAPILPQNRIVIMPATSNSMHHKKHWFARLIELHMNMAASVILNAAASTSFVLLSFTSASIKSSRLISLLCSME